MKANYAIFWFRRDLRLTDNAGLFHALKNHKNVLPLFIYDHEILGQLPDKKDRRVHFIKEVLQSMQMQLRDLGSDILIRIGSPAQVFEDLLKEMNISAVYANHDYEPYAVERDEKIRSFLEKKNIPFRTFKDQCIFEKKEVIKADGLPYTVFTPYSTQWKAKLLTEPPVTFDCPKYYSSFTKIKLPSQPSLQEIGFEKTDLVFDRPDLSTLEVKSYGVDRDYPSRSATTRAGNHLRFGTISIRQFLKAAAAQSETLVNQVIWRDFYMMILFNFPHVVTQSFKKQYDNIQWRNNEKEFEAWCSGHTGYPLVDAGMRELAATGYMHNRVRMVVASFLAKHLLIDWRWGEAWFANQLDDFELSSNNGSWQWAAGCGCDAAPYFRIFNPEKQQKKFDKDLKYIKKWVPEFGTPAYPAPIVDHKFARERALATYKRALDQNYAR